MLYSLFSVMLQGSVDMPAAMPKDKSAAALRTISEVAEIMELPQHVLRFWETKFPQIQPLKRRGGRRFYRPEDITTLETIRTLLHEKGYTIKGVQALLNGSAEALRRAREDISFADAARRTPPSDRRGTLEDIRKELVEIRGILRQAG